MNGYENIGALIVSKLGTAIQRDKGIVISRHGRLDLRFILEQIEHFQPHGKIKFFFRTAVGAFGAGILIAVTWIDDDFVLSALLENADKSGCIPSGFPF